MKSICRGLKKHGGAGLALALSLSLLCAPPPAFAVDGECDYVSDDAYRRLDPQEIDCVFTWIQDKSVPNEGRCVRLSVDKYSESGAIMLSLKNRCPHAIIFHEALLPWNASSGLEMEVVATRSPDHPLRGNNPPSYSMKYVVLGPEKSIRAIFPLDSRFPGFNRALQRRDLMLYWYFQFNPRSPLQEGGILFRSLRGLRSEQTAAPAEQGRATAEESASERLKGTEAVDEREAAPVPAEDESRGSEETRR